MNELLTQAPGTALSLSPRVQRLLAHHQIMSVSELLRYTPPRLQQLHRCGALAVQEIQLALDRIGLRLKREQTEEA